MFQNFGDLLKGSLWTLPWIFLLPLAAILLEVSVFNRDGINFSVVGSNEAAIWNEESWGLDESDYADDEDMPDEKGGVYSILALGKNLIVVLLLAAIAANLFLLLLIPCSFGGLDPATKRAQFYIGFFINIGLAVVVPLLFFYLSKFFYMAPGYFPVMVLLFVVAYVLPFVIGSRFVARAFRKAFWFW
ncbi:MAG: hypothetical protein LBO04_08515 [Spirochaetaceae bacterium]|jgi:hypothetical protein|nr:hypothetical protein [Spirochaetaceae bacterium]